MSAPQSPSVSESAQKTVAERPRLAIFFATACGLGELPRAPGTCGSLGGLAVTIATYAAVVYATVPPDMGRLLLSVGDRSNAKHIYWLAMLLETLVIAAGGVFVAGRAASFWGEDDPQKVVIDEVSGQQLTLLLGCALPVWGRPVLGVAELGFWKLLRHDYALNWKYLLVGLILFRVFDIWKPFPARQAESLPGGWGIMADDWMAGVYAGLGLWIARIAGL